MYNIGSFIGSLLSVYLLTRLLFFIQRKLQPDTSSLQAKIIVYALYMVLATILGGYGLSQTGAPEFAAAFIQYLPAAVILFLYEMYRDKSSTSSGNSQTITTSTIIESGVDKKQFCSQCGEKTDKDAKFCGNCGTAI